MLRRSAGTSVAHPIVTMTSNELLGTIHNYVVTSFMFSDGTGLSDDDSLLEAGVIDSTGVLELVSFLEREFSIRISDEDLVPTNLDTIRNIARFVTRKAAAS